MKPPITMFYVRIKKFRNLNSSLEEFWKKLHHKQIARFKKNASEILLPHRKAKLYFRI